MMADEHEGLQASLPFVALWLRRFVACFIPRGPPILLIPLEP